MGAVWRRKEATQLFPVGWTDKRTMNCLSAPPLHTHISISLACLSLDYFLLITIFGGSLHFVAHGKVFPSTILSGARLKA